MRLRCRRALRGPRVAAPATVARADRTASVTRAAPTAAAPAARPGAVPTTDVAPVVCLRPAPVTVVFPGAGAVTLARAMTGLLPRPDIGAAPDAEPPTTGAPPEGVPAGTRTVGSEAFTGSLFAPSREAIPGPVRSSGLALISGPALTSGRGAGSGALVLVDSGFASVAGEDGTGFGVYEELENGALEPAPNRPPLSERPPPSERPALSERPADGVDAAAPEDPPGDEPPSGCRPSDDPLADDPLPEEAEPSTAPAPLPGDGFADEAPSALDAPTEPLPPAPSCERLAVPMLSPAVEIRIGVVGDSPASGRLPDGRAEPESASA